MRLDKYLKVSRLIKRRTVANEVADAGRILIEPGSSNCQKLRLVRPGQEDLCSEYSESPWFYEVAEIAMILALKDYDACYAALKRPGRSSPFWKSPGRMHSWAFELSTANDKLFGVFCSCQISQDYL